MPIILTYLKQIENINGSEMLWLVARFTLAYFSSDLQLVAGTHAHVFNQTIMFRVRGNECTPVTKSKQIYSKYPLLTIQSHRLRAYIDDLKSV